MPRRQPQNFPLRFVKFAAGGLLLLIGIIITFINLAVIHLIVFYVLNKAELASRLKMAAACFYFATFRIAIEDIAGTKMVFWGDKIPPGESVIMFANHIGFFDFAYLFPIAERARILPFSKFFAKDEIRHYGPWGWCMSLLEMIWVKRDWTDDDNRIRNVFAKQWEHPTIPICLLTFLEGRRLTPKRHEESIEFAKSRNLPVLKNTLYPRVKGFKATIQGIGPLLDAVYDVTIGYSGKDFPDLFAFLSGSYSDEIHFHIRRTKIDVLSSLSEDELNGWVYNVWKEKDSLLDYFYKNDKFPGARLEFPPFGILDNVKSSFVVRSLKNQ